jgi:deoxyribose-phosphate aldolase
MNWDRELAGVIDHTILKPSATERDVLMACDEAVRYGFACLVVAPFYLPVAVSRLQGSRAKVCTVVSFPFGAHMPMAKADEARRYINAGAEEIDAVMNIGAFLSGEHNVVQEEIKGLAAVCRDRAVFKFIIETAYLSPEQISTAAKLAGEFGVDLVKTSTGHAERGATTDDVRIIRVAVGDSVGVKASGGIKTAAFARELLEAGATRLGCSASVRVVSQ